MVQGLPAISVAEKAISVLSIAAPMPLPWLFVHGAGIADIYSYAKRNIMKFFQNLLGGLAGAVALNLLHETVRRFDSDAPRIDLVGEEGLNKMIESSGGEALEGGELYAATLVGDLFSNSLYYSAIGAGKDKHLVTRGAMFGIVAGIGALELTAPAGLSDAPVTRTRKTKMMTIGYYLAGGLVTAFVIKKLRYNKP